jgi:thiol:disulfide interchange protein DsbC
MKRTILATSIALLCFAAHASDAKTIGSRLKAAFPQIPDVQEVNASPIAGLKEVVLPGEIIYVDEKGEYMLQGHLVRLSDRSDLTTARIEDINRIDFSSLPLDKAIVHKYGTGEHKIAIFADPNCGYCKRLENETMPSVENATVFTMPLAILSADSEIKLKRILCNPNPADAWSAWMLKGQAPAEKIDGKCEEAAQKTISEVRDLGRKYGVTGTPTIIFEDGSRIPGFVPAATLNKRLSETKINKH